MNDDYDYPRLEGFHKIHKQYLKYRRQLETMKNRRCCSKCLHYKRLEEFPAVLVKKGRKNMQCKACRAEYEKQWRERNEGHVKAERLKLKIKNSME